MVRHILKDGREVKSIAGIVIRQQDHEDLYAVIDRIKKRYEGERKNEYGSSDAG